MSDNKNPILGTDHTLVADQTAGVLRPAFDGGDAGAGLPFSIPPEGNVAGTLLGGRYEVIGLLGAGGMGSVYRAHDRELDENVALKVLSREMLAAPGILERFRQEVKLARRVTHLNVARTFDIGEHEGQKFLTMELVEGEPLSRILEREGPLSVRRMLDIAKPICNGLGAAHGAEVVHRDLKPDNILISKDGRVVITDFGIARAFAGSAVKTQGLPIGTPAYMAPEQVEGKADIDARADIYALGTMLFEMATGMRAWDGDAALSVAVARLMSPPPDPRDKRADLPDEVAEMILRCMQQRPEERYSSVTEILAAMDALDEAAISHSAPRHPPSSRGPRHGDHTAAGDKAVAVLPFRNAGDAGDDYLADGLTDDILDALSMRPGLKVRSRGAVAAFKGNFADPKELGRALRVHVIVAGSVRRIGSQLRVTVRLVSVPDGFQLWAKRFDRPTGEVLLVGDEAARSIAAVLTVARRTQPEVAKQEAGEVIDLYLRGRHEYHKFWGDSNARAIDLFQRALALAPDHPRVLGAYALALMRRFQIEAGQDAAADEALEVARRALGIDPANAEAHVALAGIAWAHGDAVTAARELVFARESNPRLGDAEDYYGRLLMEVGLIDEGISHLVAAADAEPGVRAHTLVDIARGRALQGSWKEAFTLLEKPMTRDVSSINNYWLVRTRLVGWKDDRQLAQEWLMELASEPDFEAKTMAMGILATILSRRIPHEALKFLNERTRHSPEMLRRRAFMGQIQAEVAGLLGDTPACVRALCDADRAALYDLAWLERCPLLSAARAHPDYARVLESVRARAAEVKAAFGIVPSDVGLLDTLER